MYFRLSGGLRYVPKKQFRLSWIKQQKQSNTSVMGLMPTSGIGITSADVKLQRARWRHILLRRIMPNSDITLLASLVNHFVYLGIPMLLNVRCVYSFLLSTAGNFLSNDFQIMLLMLLISLAHDI
jgi:hypothetical protein